MPIAFSRRMRASARMQAVICIGYTLLLFACQLSVWGGMKLSARSGFDILPLLTWWSVPLLASIGLTLLALGAWSMKRRLVPAKRAPAPANMQRVVRSMRRAAAWLRPSCFLPSCFAAFRMRRRSGAGMGRRHALDGMGRRVRPHGSRQGDAIGAGRACRKLLPVHRLGAFAHGRPRSRLCCVVHRVDLLARLRAKGWCIAERAGLLRAVAIAWRNAFFEGEGPARKQRAFERRSPFGKRSRPTGGSGIERRPETRRRRTRCPSDGQPAGQGNVGGVEQSPVLCGGHCLRGGHHAYDDAAHQARFGRNSGGGRRA